MLPWEGYTVAGTTDATTKITRFPHPHEKEIKYRTSMTNANILRFILEALQPFLHVKVRRDDVRASWSGIR